MPTAQCHPGCQQAAAQAFALDDQARRVDNAFAPSNYYELGCDTAAPFDADGGARWYVFEGAAGTHMPTQPPGALTCGTQYAGWLSTPHPSAGEPPTAGVVCFDADYGAYQDCYMSEDVEVCTCELDVESTIYAYRLRRPPRCYAGYCGTSESLTRPCAPAPGSYSFSIF